MQTAHPDLAASVVGQYDGTDDDSFQEPNPWDGHGTSCAGLAAAIGNAIGVKGVGAGCSILAVRIAYSRAPQSDWITTNEIIARSIDWSWQNGAWVLSKTAGAEARLQMPSWQPSSVREPAAVKARAVSWSSPLAIRAVPVQFPANIANVLAVSASNEFDEFFKSRTSRDGETWWGIVSSARRSLLPRRACTTTRPT